MALLLDMRLLIPTRGSPTATYLLRSFNSENSVLSFMLRLTSTWLMSILFFQQRTFTAIATASMVPNAQWFR